MTTIEHLKKYRYAHRGYHNKPEIPENSLPAFRRSIERGWGAEFDVHIIKDGSLVVFHDSVLKRCAGVDGIIEELDLEGVKELRLEGTDNCIPTFDEVLALFEESGLPLIIELKSRGKNHMELSEAVCRRLDSYKGDFCVESFDPRVVKDIRTLRPEIIRGQLSEDFIKNNEDVPWWQAPLLTDLFLNFAKKPHFVAYKYEDRENPKNLESIAKGIQEVSWTIRSKADLLQVEANGAIPIFECFDPDEE